MRTDGDNMRFSRPGPTASGTSQNDEVRQRRYVVTCPERCGWNFDLAAGTRTRWINRLSKVGGPVPRCPECGAELDAEALQRARKAC